MMLYPLLPEFAPITPNHTGSGVPQEKADGFGKEADCVRELKKLGGDTEQAIDQVNLGQNVALFRPFHLSFPNHIHRLVAGQCTARRLEGKETQAGSGAAFDEAVVLFDPILEKPPIPHDFGVILAISGSSGHSAKCLIRLEAH